jgi:hypothetical protein
MSMTSTLSSLSLRIAIGAAKGQIRLPWQKFLPGAANLIRFSPALTNNVHPIGQAACDRENTLTSMPRGTTHRVRMQCLRTTDWNSTFFAESGLERLSALLKTDEASD